MVGVDEYDTVCSGAGDDVVRAHGGRDVDLGPGDDRFTGSASRVLAALTIVLTKFVPNGL